MAYRLALTLTCLLCSFGVLSADDWPGWLGASRDGVYRETGIVESIPDSGLPVKWRTAIAGGYAGPAVADGKVFVFDYQQESGELVNDPNARAKLGGAERLQALDVHSGEKIWEYSYRRDYEISYPAGPRATPTIDDGKVFLLGAEGDLTCLSAADGTLIWHRNLPSDFDAEVPTWGFAAHPLIDGELLYTMVGGKGQGVVAFEKSTGQVRWKSLDAQAGYCAPRIIHSGGRRQLIVFHPEAVVALDPASGDEFWNIPIKPSYEMSIAQPMVEGDRMYVSAIHTEAVMIGLGADAPTATELWRGEAKNAVHCNNAPPMFVDGVIYGADCLQGSLIAVDATNGDRLWETFQATQPEEKRFIKHGTAFITRIGQTDRYLVMSENGDLILAALTAKGFDELGRMHVVEPTNEAFGRPVVWSHPAYAGKTAFIRNDKEIVAIDLSR